LKAISTYQYIKAVRTLFMPGSNTDFLFIGEEDYMPSTEEPFRTDTYVISYLKQGQLSVIAGPNAGGLTGPLPAYTPSSCTGSIYKA
jgi:AraC family transcriptional activator of pobA